MATSSIAGPQLPADDVVEKIGFGRFHYSCVAMAYGIWFSDGIEVGFSSVLTPSIAYDLGIDEAQRAMLASVTFVGMGVGCVLGGYLGDTVGRRLPVLLSYLGIVVFALISACMNSLATLATMRFAVGAFMGLGQPASMALVNESAPAQWREVLQGVRGVSFALGYLFSIIVILIDDPSLTYVHWRVALAISVVPPSLLGLWSYSFLCESPVFLAESGQKEHAEHLLQEMARQNGRSIGQITLRTQSSVSLDKQMSGGRQLAVVCGPRYAFITFALSFAAVAMNLVEYGIAYAEPLVLPEVSGNVAPGWQMFTKYSLAVAMRISVISLAVVLSRKAAYAAATLTMIVGILSFAWTAGFEERGTLSALLYYTSQYLPPLGLALGFLTVYQLSVDVYPTMVAATGTAMCLGMGRIGAILSPFAFEWLSKTDWQHFYHFLAVICIISLGLFLSLPDFASTKKDAMRDLEEVIPFRS